MPNAQTPIDAYLANLEAPAKQTLTKLRNQLRKMLPKATETLSYAMPAFRMENGKVAAGFAFFGKHCGYYPHSGGVVPQLKSALKGYKTSKSGVTFSPEEPLPEKIVQILVKTRLKEIAALEKTKAAPKRKPTRTTTRTRTKSRSASSSVSRRKSKV